MALPSSVLPQLFDASPNPYMVLDRELRYVAANPAYLRVTDSELEQLVGRHVLDAFPNDPDDPNNGAARLLRDSLQRVLDTRAPDIIALIPYRVGRAEPVRYWSATHAPLFDAQGEVQYILQHTVDVTELQQDASHGGALEAGVLGRARTVQRANVTMSQELRHLRALFEQAPGFMCFLRGRDYVFELANAAYLRLIGQRNVIGMPLRDALPEIREQGFLELLDRASTSGQPFIGRGVRVLLKREHGEDDLDERFLDFVYQPIYDGEGRYLGVFVQGHDITAQKHAQDELTRYRDQLELLVRERTAELERSEQERGAAEAKLRQAQKMEAVGNLTGGIAHDFNNLLQVIGGNLNLLKGDLPQTRRAERRLRSATDAVERGARLASHLLAFARRQPLQPQPLHLGRVVRQLRELLRRSLGDAIAITLQIDEQLWNTYADPNQIDNVLLNLAINARDAMESRGTLTIRLDNASLVDATDELPAGDYVHLSVSDTGCGMSEQQLERAFEPFFTTKPEGQGTGLGLSMVYGFAKQSGGHVKLSSALGEGTTVQLWLPRSMELELRSSRPPAEHVQGGGETLLVVEDDASVRETVVEMLAELGYRVLQAAEAQSALAVLSSGVRIDLLFTDVVMPGPVSSAELAQQARRMLPGLEVLFTSGYTRDVILHQGRIDADVTLLSKPYGRDELARKIRSMLRRRTAREPVEPTSPSPPHEAPELRAERAAPEPLRVLVVEDDPDVRELVSELLEQHGHQLTQAGSAEEALGLDVGAFDVLFSDIGLPGASGVELAQALLARAPSLRIVLASGYGVAVQQLPEALHGARVLAKPYDEHELLRVLAER